MNKKITAVEIRDAVTGKLRYYEESNSDLQYAMDLISKWLGGQDESTVVIAITQRIEEA